MKNESKRCYVRKWHYNSKGLVPNACQISSLNPPPITLSQLPYFPSTLVACILDTVYLVCTLIPCILGIYPCTLYTVPCILYTLYNCILLLIFDRPQRCLGAAPVPCGPLPRVPGAPPWGGSRHQSTRVNPTHAHLVFASKFISILMSVLGRFAVDLGSLLGVHFAPFGALVGLSWSQNRLRSVLSSKK